MHETVGTSVQGSVQPGGQYHVWPGIGSTLRCGRYGTIITVGIFFDVSRIITITIILESRDPDFAGLEIGYSVQGWHPMLHVRRLNTPDAATDASTTTSVHEILDLFGFFFLREIGRSHDFLNLPSSFFLLIFRHAAVANHGAQATRRRSSARHTRASLLRRTRHTRTPILRRARHTRASVLGIHNY
jgi:hypothetical protein